MTLKEYFAQVILVYSIKEMEENVYMLNWNPSFQFASLSSDLANRLHK